MSNSPEEIIQEIQDSFAEVACPDADHLVQTLNHFQAENIIRDFAGKNWAEVTAKMLYEYRYDLFLFTPEAFHFYLPAFITISLSQTDDSEYPFDDELFFHLIPFVDMPSHIDEVLESRPELTTQQRAQIAQSFRNQLTKYNLPSPSPDYEDTNLAELRDRMSILTTQQKTAVAKFVGHYLKENILEMFTQLYRDSAKKFWGDLID